ncbi:MAG: cupin domain-containing protein [Rhizomicrobium sp.]
MKRLLFALCLSALSALSATALAAPAPVTTPIVSTDTTIIGQKIEVPKDPTVIVSTITFAPGARTPVHKHLYPHYAYVLEGTLTITNVETGKSFVITKGQFLAEMQNTWHYGENRGKTPVRLLIVDHVPKGVTQNSVAKDVGGPAH